MTEAAETRIACLTPPGQGALATLGLHGPSAWELIRTLFRPHTGALPESPRAGTFRLGRLSDGTDASDEVVLAVKTPATLELHCHGGREAVRFALDLFAARGTDLIADPGSYLYTPLPEKRDFYRSAAAHFAPRPVAGPPAADIVAPFLMQHRGFARCAYFGPLGAAAVLDGPGWRTYRVLRFSPGALTITDACSSGPLSPLRPVPMSHGYGRREPGAMTFAESVPQPAATRGAA